MADPHPPRSSSLSNSYSSLEGRPTPQRTNSNNMRLSPSPSPGHSHRPSFTEQLRGAPPSPRQQRHMSLSQAQVQDLLANPPTAGQADPKFKGRDWQHIAVGELVDSEDVRFVELDTGIEEATNVLTQSHLPVLLVRSSKSDKTAAATFDYRDLTQYLLFATGQLVPSTNEYIQLFQSLAKKAQAGQTIPLREAKLLGSQETFVTLPHTAQLTAAVELFGGGVHRIVIVKEGTGEVVGILSQLRLVKFLWENGGCFPVIDQLYSKEISQLGIGSLNLISINGDRPLKEALILMNSEGVSSLAIVDNQYNVIGNISNVDVKLLTKSSSAPLLENTCIHFISVILSTRGMNDGKDSYPVYYINSYSTLAHTVAKLVATSSHRMWVVDSGTPNSSTPSTPLPTQPSHHHSSSTSSAHSLSSLHAPSPSITNQHSTPISIAHPPPVHPPHLTTNLPQANPPFQPLSSTPSVSASALPGQNMSGRLNGVVSLTDVLNLFARATGLNPEDPEEARRKRRGSSSSSRSEVRASMDSGRSGGVRNNLLGQVENFVKQYMDRFDASHDFQHVQRILRLAKSIEQRELISYRSDIVELASLLHEIGDPKYLSKRENGETMVERLLLNFKADAAPAQDVQAIVNNVSYSNENKNPLNVG